jgi:hypothetical protein
VVGEIDQLRRLTVCLAGMGWLRKRCGRDVLMVLMGYHVTGSIGTLFLYGVVVGAVGLFGLSLMLAGARRTSRRAVTRAAGSGSPDGRRLQSARIAATSSTSARPPAHTRRARRGTARPAATPT